MVRTRRIGNIEHVIRYVKIISYGTYCRLFSIKEFSESDPLNCSDKDGIWDLIEYIDLKVEESKKFDYVLNLFVESYEYDKLHINSNYIKNRNEKDVLKRINEKFKEYSADKQFNYPNKNIRYHNIDFTDQYEYKGGQQKYKFCFTWLKDYIEKIKNFNIDEIEIHKNFITIALMLLGSIMSQFIVGYTPEEVLNSNYSDGDDGSVNYKVFSSFIDTSNSIRSVHSNFNGKTSHEIYIEMEFLKNSRNQYAEDSLNIYSYIIEYLGEKIGEYEKYLEEFQVFLNSGKHELPYHFDELITEICKYFFVVENQLYFLALYFNTIFNFGYIENLTAIVVASDETIALIQDFMNFMDRQHSGKITEIFESLDVLGNCAKYFD